MKFLLRSWHTGKFPFESSFRKWLSKENLVCVMKTFASFLFSKAAFSDWRKFYSGKFSLANGPLWLVERVYVVNNNMEWTDDKVLHLIDLLKDVPVLYVINWIYVGRSRVSCLCIYTLAHQLFAAQVAGRSRVSCLCIYTLAHQLFAAQVAVMYKLPPFNPWPGCGPWSRPH